MIRSKLGNTFLKDKNEQSRNDYEKQRKFCVTFISRARQQYFCSLDLSLIADNKKYWKTVKSLFSDKTSHTDIISLTEDGKTITKDPQIVKFKNHPSILSINKNMERKNVLVFRSNLFHWKKQLNKLIN